MKQQFTSFSRKESGTYDYKVVVRSAARIRTMTPRPLPLEPATLERWINGCDIWYNVWATSFAIHDFHWNPGFVHSSSKRSNVLMDSDWNSAPETFGFPVMVSCGFLIWYFTGDRQSGEHSTIIADDISRSSEFSLHAVTISMKPNRKPLHN